MASVTTRSFKQTNGYFVAVSTIVSTSQYVVSAASSGAGGSAVPPSFTKAGTASGANFVTGAMLKDMGKTVVSSSHTFRKVQAVVAGSGAVNASTPLTGMPFYIELNTGNALQTGTGADYTGAAPVAYLPGLW